MSQYRHKKVALVTISLAGGGAERSVAELSKMLTILGHEVHIITITDAIGYAYKGQLLNLGVYKKKTFALSVLKSLIAFRSYLKEQSIELIIDHRTRSSSFKERIYGRFVYRDIPLILVSHSANSSMYFTEKAPQIYKNIQAVVGVSSAISKSILQQFDFKKVCTIHNAIPVLEEAEKPLELPKRYILSYGRIVDEVKNYRLLLDAFAKSSLRDSRPKGAQSDKAYPSIQTSLVLMGDGSDVEMLINYTKELGIDEAVIFLPNQSKPKAIIENALCVTLTSRFEGFPMVLVEALSLGVPVLSVDCDSGPAELIAHEKNGLLVKNHDVDAFAQALTRISTDATLRQQLANEAKSSVSFLETETIATQWEKLLSSI